MLNQSMLGGLLDPKSSSLSLTALAQVAALSGKRLVVEIRVRLSGHQQKVSNDRMSIGAISPMHVCGKSRLTVEFATSMQR